MIKITGGWEKCPHCSGTGIVLSTDHTFQQCGCVLVSLDTAAANADSVISRAKRQALEDANMVVVPKAWVIR